MRDKDEPFIRVVHETAHKMHLSANRNANLRESRPLSELDKRTTRQQKQAATVVCAASDGEKYLETCSPCNVHPLRIKQFLFAAASQGLNLEANPLVVDAVDQMASKREDGHDLRDVIEKSVLQERELATASRKHLSR